MRVQGLTDRDRQRNLTMLKRIAELAQQRGLDFTLAIWMQAPSDSASSRHGITIETSMSSVGVIGQQRPCSRSTVAFCRM